DYHLIVLTPSSVQEMADLTSLAFDLADKYRMPSMLLADGTMGQMMEPVSLPEEHVNVTEKPWAVTGTEMKRKHNIVNSLFLVPEELEKYNFERYQRYAEIEKNEARFEEYMTDDADYCLVAFGIASRVSKKAVQELRGLGIKAGLVRPITVWPFPKEPIARLSEKVKAFVSVELSMGQMIEDIELAEGCRRPVCLCNRAGGMIPTVEQIVRTVCRMKECE
ncbi:MAG: 3-methyl-2-oxobutanoate dehydrogenase subunit beta, partial [Clostridia bacterium]|nr:3-methyl-2-oxobutanoate dehydrogenase subunit beta [Clostridia bacterium]